MHMPMGQLCRTGRAHAGHDAVESERLAGQRVIAVHSDFVVGHLDHGEEQIIIVVGAFGAAFELHTDSHFPGE